MKKYDFSLETDEDVIIIDALIDNYPIRLAVDTAATHTVVDWNMLMMIGYLPQNGSDWVQLETSNGVIEAQAFLLNHFNIKLLDLLLIKNSYLSFLSQKKA